MEELIFYERPKLKKACMVIGFSGWMDGGGVSSGAISLLRDSIKTRLLAEIDSRNFYILNFPGTMEEVAQFRPHAVLKNGLIKNFEYPRNEFSYSEEHNLVFFFGKEPNFRWEDFCNHLLTVAEEVGVERIFFVGSFSGLTPHTREPRLYCSFSHERLKEELTSFGVRFSDYEGPASIATLLLLRSRERSIEMFSVAVEIPMYVRATNPKGIRAALRFVVPFLGIEVDWAELDKLCDDFERHVDELVKQYPDLEQQIRKLEENYDKEILGDDQSFKDWLRRHGIDTI